MRECIRRLCIKHHNNYYLDLVVNFIDDDFVQYDKDLDLVVIDVEYIFEEENIKNFPFLKLLDKNFSDYNLITIEEINGDLEGYFLRSKN